VLQHFKPSSTLFQFYVTFKVACMCVKVYNELGQSSNNNNNNSVDLCHLTVCIYNPDILAV